MALYCMSKSIKFDKSFPVLYPNNVVDLNNLSSISEQMKGLTTLLEMPPEELPKRQAACEEVLQVLRKYYPESSLQLYGSSINSFGVKGCDMDLLFIPFRNYSNSDHEEDKAEEVTIPDPASILNGEVSKTVLEKFKESSHLKFVRSVLRSEKVGKKANVIILQKRRFLKVSLKNDNLSCTISASNKLIAFTSELLQFYGRLDERIKPLVICLQAWGKALGFIKRNLFSSDSFTLLVIFFLQSVNPPILPSVQQLTKMSGSSRMMAGWETAFCTNVRRVPKSKNTLTVGELLVQFFDFYFHFDFSQNVVSPHCGKALPIKEIQSSKDKRMENFKIREMNIQDLFILSNNVCTVENLTVFKLAALTATEMLKGKDKMKFPTFFNPDAYQYILDVHYNRYLSCKTQACFIRFDYDCIQKFNGLQVWYEKASQAIFDVLHHGLLVDCEVIDKANNVPRKSKIASISMNGSSKDQGSINGKTSTPYDLQLLISIQCIVYSKTYIGRKNVKLGSQNDMEVDTVSVLDIERRISESLIEKNSLLKSSVPLLVFNCECYRHEDPKLTDFIMMLKPLFISNEFKQASTFLASFLPEVMKKILISN